MTLAEISEWAYHYLKACAPVHSGNLKENAIQIVQKAPNEFEIKIDADIAPYAVYTNEKWVSPHWKGKKNPNEKWIDEAVKHIAETICHMVGGKFTRKRGIKPRWENKKYWDAVKKGKITRNDNIIAIDGTVRKASE